MTESSPPSACRGAVAGSARGAMTTMPATDATTPDSPTDLKKHGWLATA